MRLSWTGVFFLFWQAVFAQATYQDDRPDAMFQQGVALFDQAQYQDARETFDRYLDLESDVGSRAEAKLYLARIELMVNEDPAAIKMVMTTASEVDRQKANRHLGDFYFETGAYEEAISSYGEVGELALSNGEGERLTYRLAYAYLETGNATSAYNGFKKTITFNGDLAPRANYYAGTLAFDAGNPDVALGHFLEAEKEQRLIQLTAPYIARIYLENDAYQRVIDYVDNTIAHADNKGNLVLHRLAGEAHFALQNYEQAAISFEESLRLGKNRSDEVLYYKLGYCFDQEDKPDLAIKYYKTAALSKSETGQAAAFRLGELYLDSDQINYANSAFESASKADYNAAIAEQALFLYAKGLYTLGQFDQAIFVLNAFRETYPESKDASEVFDLLVSAFLNNSNYDAAIQYLEQPGNINSDLARETYQKVTFFKGQLLFNDSKFKAATDWFRKSITYPEDAGFVTDARFLLAEALSVQRQFEASIAHYRHVIRTTPEAQEMFYKAAYGLGYAYYNTQNYSDAYVVFRRFIDSAPNDHPYRYDALTRIGDCHFVQQEFAKAMERYNELLTAPNSDYIRFQLGLVYYFTDRLEQAKQFLREVYEVSPASYYADNASLQRAEILMDEEKFDESFVQYGHFLTNYQDSPLTPYAYLGRGMSQSNMESFEGAEKDFETILTNYINHPTAQEALLGLQDLVGRGYEVSNFDSYLTRLRQMDPSNENFESIAFEQAKAYYYNQDYARVISSGAKFAGDYPNSPFLQELNYYLADSYYRTAEWGSAIELLQALSQDLTHPYLTRILDKLGEAYRETNKPGRALKVYRELAIRAKNRRDTYNALEGLMETHFMQEAYDSTRYYAEQILQAQWKPLDAEKKCVLLAGKAYLAEDNVALAIRQFERLGNSTDEYGAEAAYLMSKSTFDQGDTDEAIELALNLISAYGSYPRWTDEAYLLLVDIYVAKDELLQAKATLTSIIEQASDSTLLDRANRRLEEVQRLEGEVLTETPEEGGK